MKNNPVDCNLYVPPHDYNISFCFLIYCISVALRFLWHKRCIHCDSTLLLCTLDFWRGEKAAATEQSCLLGIVNNSLEPYSNLTFTMRFGPCEIPRHAKGMRSTQQESQLLISFILLNIT